MIEEKPLCGKFKRPSWATSLTEIHNECPALEAAAATPPQNEGQSHAGSRRIMLRESRLQNESKSSFLFAPKARANVRLEFLHTAESELRQVSARHTGTKPFCGAPVQKAVHAPVRTPKRRKAASAPRPPPRSPFPRLAMLKRLTISELLTHRMNIQP